MRYERGGRRPETGQKKHQQASAQYKKQLLERPLLPVFPDGFPPPFPTVNEKAVTPKTAPSYVFSAERGGLIMGLHHRK